MLDRGVAQTLKIKGKGVDFPFDGGTADITSALLLLAVRLEPAARSANRQRRRGPRT